MPLSPLCAFLGLYAWILRKTHLSVRGWAKMAPARTPRAANPGHKAQWSATRTILATPDAGTLWRRPVPSKPYRYAKYPAMDRLFDVLADHGLPGSSINVAITHGRHHLTVLLPGNRFTDEYEGADIQAVAQRWLNAETGEDNEGRTVILAMAGYENAKAAA
jgi:hypothetical protein